MSCHCLSINCMNPKRQLLIALASSVNAMQLRNPPQQILIHNPKMSCRVTLLIQLLDSGHPKYPYALLATLVENSNFIGDKSGRMPGSSRAEDVCWDKQGHQGLSTLIHNTMHLRIDNNTMHPMQIIHNIVYLYITLTTLCLCAIYFALIHNTMHFCIIFIDNNIHHNTIHTIHLCYPQNCLDFT